jgi:hypothetical protein
VKLDDGAPSYDEFYDIDALWPAESLARRKAYRAKLAQR